MRREAAKDCAGSCPVSRRRLRRAWRRHARRELEVALRLLNRVRGTLPQGRSLPDGLWWGRHRARLLILWLHVPALTLLAVVIGKGPEEASGVVVVAA